MPDLEGLPALHRLCDSVSGANWRLTRFEDELTVNQYACRVCHVIPCTTVVLPCSHILCEQCLTGCVVQDGGSVCPLDAQPFCEDECQKLKLPAKTKHNLKAHCWNEADGCQFVGSVDAVLLHFDRECAFHALQCPRCEQRILRTDIAAHYVSGCSQNSSCESGAPPNGQDSSPTRCYENAVLKKLSALQMQVNELFRTSDSARLDGVCRAVSEFESSCLRVMEGIESTISMMTRQPGADLEEVNMLDGDPLSDQLASLERQVNELAEQSREHVTSEMEEAVRVLTDSQTELKRDVRAQLKLMAHSRFTESLTAQLQEFRNSLKDSTCQLKELVAKGFGYLFSKIADNQKYLQRELDSIKQESSKTERPLGAVALGKEYNPRNMQEQFIPLKMDVFIHETLNILEVLRQQIHRHDKKLWVSSLPEPCRACGPMRNHVSLYSLLNVTLGNAGNIFGPDGEHSTVANLVYYGDVHIRATFRSSIRAGGMFYINVDCYNSSGNSSFPFTETAVEACRRYPGDALAFRRVCLSECDGCSENNISQLATTFSSTFEIEHGKLAEDGVIVNGELKLRIRFR